jgi:hypothetical protein
MFRHLFNKSHSPIIQIKIERKLTAIEKSMNFKPNVLAAFG